MQVDASAFSGPTMAPGWDPADIVAQRSRPIEAMIDAGRIQPTVNSETVPHPRRWIAGRELLKPMAWTRGGDGRIGSDRRAAGKCAVGAVDPATVSDDERLRTM